MTKYPELTLRRFTDTDTAVSPILPGLTLESLREKHAHVTEQWLANDTYREYEQLFVNTILQQQSCVVDQAMCLGLGSLSSRTYCDRHDRSMEQLVVFESLLDVLRQRFKIERTLFQEPLFTDLDQAFIKQRGFQIIESPASEDHTSDTTFVFAPAAEQMVTESVLAFSHPAILLGPGDLTTQNSFFENPRYADRTDFKKSTRVFSTELEFLPSKPYDRNDPRPCRAEYIALRVAETVPEYTIGNTDNRSDTIYYKPDDTSRCGRWDYNDEGLYTYEEALKYWDQLERDRQKSAHTKEEESVPMS